MSGPAKQKLDGPPPSLDFDALKLNMAEVQRLTYRLHGRTLLDSKGTQLANSSETMRDLRRLEDLLRASRVLVNNEMWVARGYQDMLGV